jgi:peptidoglycan/LPS O-acetylase OafA/YrhL
MVAPVQFLGKISYSIYMVHTFILTSLAISIKRVFKVPMDVDLATNLTFPRIDPWIGDVLLSAIVLVVVAVSALTYKFIEEPCRTLGRHLAAYIQIGHRRELLSTTQKNAR